MDLCMMGSRFTRTTRSVRPSGLNAQIEEKLGLSATINKEVGCHPRKRSPCRDVIKLRCLLDANERPQD